MLSSSAAAAPDVVTDSEELHDIEEVADDVMEELGQPDTESVVDVAESGGKEMGLGWLRQKGCDAAAAVVDDEAEGNDDNSDTVGVFGCYTSDGEIVDNDDILVADSRDDTVVDTTVDTYAVGTAALPP